MKRNIYASVEFGTHTLKLLVSEFVDGKQNILFIDELQSSGIEDGLVYDKSKVINECQQLIKKAEHYLDATIKSVVIMLPSVNLRTKEIGYDITIPDGRVRGKHIKDLFNKVYTEEITKIEQQKIKDEIAFIHPRRFISSKSRKSLLNPINEMTRELNVSLEIVYENKQMIIDYLEVIDALGIEVLDIMPNAVAYKNSLLSKEEMANYCAVIDIGSHVTTISVYHDNLILKSESFKIGGQIVTDAIKDDLSLSLKAAEEFKITHGLTVSKEATGEIVYEQKHEDGSITYVTTEYVAKLIDEQYLAILRVIRQYLLETGLKNKITKFILIGGAMAIENIETLFKHNFGENVHLRRPDFIGARHPKFSSIISSHYHIYHLEQILEEEHIMVAFNH
jgi:cell division protein FtsA